MVETGTVWRIEVTSSTLLYAEDVRQRIVKALEGEPEFERILVEELNESLKLLEKGAVD